MTPFGIRSKLKALVQKPAAREETHALRLVMPDGREHEVRCEARYTLVMASQTLETPIATHCPDGHCGHCTVTVLDATGLSQPTSAEQKILAEQKAAPNVRLACHAKVVGSGAKVKVDRIWTMDSVRGE